MFLAEVVAVHADERYMDENNRFDLNKARPLVYSHGEYLGTGKKLGTFGYSVKKRKKTVPPKTKKTAKLSDFFYSAFDLYRSLFYHRLHGPVPSVPILRWLIFQ